MLKEVPNAELTEKIIGAAIEVHKVLGPGLKEEVYEAALEVELGLRGIKCERQVPVNVVYKGVDINDDKHPKRIDMIVEKVVGIECKALAASNDPLFRAQCLTYLRMLGLKTGLVINFGLTTLRDGVRRVVNETREEYRGRLARENPIGLKMLDAEESQPAAHDGVDG